ncbi:hypothetical protein BO71DRAFT_353039 [Aspergillus ellipticus CBS 707.79]|uniref:Nucleotidyltransferase family protein n=1 Tax=Aspergillus ellipticus CBS 707.79 TaxID=1448320 RepID=A0A319DBK4_9EURO|nr:hypothetical protein BO71DRAFT_353039 [Aspergillus ellipticus CBS 707.79]
MGLCLTIETSLSRLRLQGISACLIGEIALNYYNVPRVVHDIEICVPRASLSEAVSILCADNEFWPVEKKDFDIFTEYKRGFPVLAATQSKLLLVLFPDSHFYLSPVEDVIVDQEWPPTNYSHQILELVSRDELKHLPVPRLPPYFIGLCQRFFESDDAMARISAEQLVDGMDLDNGWVRANLSSAPHQVRELATGLVAEKSSRCDGDLNQALLHTGDKGQSQNLRLIAGSGY